MENKLDPNELKDGQKKVNMVARFSGLGFQMLAMLLAGTFGGKYLDEKMGNKIPWIMLILIFLSLFGSMYLLYKEVTGMDNEKKN